MADLFEGRWGERRVLVKTVRQDVEWGEQRRMAEALRHEREGLRRVRHPGIPGVIADWEIGGIPWIVFDFVDGIDLSRISRDGRALPDPELVEVADQVLDVLASVHRPGLVHRDISPENIILGVDGRVRLVDFGLSADVEGTTGDLGPRRGKEAFAAPEQWKGDQPDPRADFYALARSLRRVRASAGSLELERWLRQGETKWLWLRPRSAERWRGGLRRLPRRPLGSWLKSCYPAGFEGPDARNPEEDGS